MTTFRKINYLLTSATAILLLGACGSSSNDNTTISPPVAQEVDYQEFLDDAVEQGIPGVIMSIEGPEIDFIGSAGLADIQQQTPMQIDHVMPNGSAGKKATALLVAMLHNDGVLNIDDTIDTWLPDEILDRIENSRSMTLRQLLNHSAGVYDYLDSATQAHWYSTIMSDPSSLKTDIYALQFALDQPAYFMPGTDFHYSNTGYLLAGLILDEVLGEHHYTEMRNRVILPLGLNSTYYNGLEKNLGTIISGYVNIDGVLENAKPVYENIGVSDAPLVSSVSDISLLLKSIVDEDSVVASDVRALITSPESMVQASNTLEYGLGIFKEMSNAKTVYHHGGDEPGYKTETFYILEDDIAFTVFFNCNGYDVCAEQSNIVVQKVLQTIL
ncbi:MULTISPECIES: serine hydrolase domain-containing protein [Aliiglaciecola]|uniref:serine hydrolase domain-containing protein n=1 Tax=Aliiglaciecola TaxID=1406885 RepID=UPI001C095EAC|nr:MULTISPECIES: serine hydrolase domain-containing protein [Aliiglaciecola]MBU2876836.1 beta-lactamase family protein [Aliiglaciecola lipolytica]MDO6711939.1 serine hydrolase domain-containing protein [Aliiglaciecola sp. 2_MG-2023]MDO6753087.1 serine hydrolase domain-containing protein [Aliiglaciecola sp. 1_MG-2023]